jgi:4-amino-4-deoxy-L-arabinose transferase-like glycosyltransferase
VQDVQVGAATPSGFAIGAPFAEPGLHADHRAPSAVSGWVVAIGLLIFGVVWLVHLGFTSLSPPVDNIEQLIWVRSLEWGYYKHPPLPTWLLWLPVQMFGQSAWTTSVLGAALTLGSMGILWRLLARLRGTTYATVALLAALCVTYYNGRLYYYNHNIVLMLASTASAALCWQAFSTRQLRWWAGLGLALGLGALSKYQVAVTVASLLVFLVHQRAWRDPAHRRGVLLAFLVALLVFVPHIEWLRSHDFEPIHYAFSTSLGVDLTVVHRMAWSAHWLVDQLLNRALPALLVLAAAIYFPTKARRAAPGPVVMVAAAGAPLRDPARALLLSWGLVPFTFMPLLGVVFGSDLQLQWGTAFLLFTVPAVMELLPRRFWDRVDLSKTLKAFLVVQALLLVLSFITSPSGPAPLRDHHWRSFDSRELAAHIAGPARDELGGAIRVVIGSTADAGALALQLPEHPVVLLDGRFDHSPWVLPELLQRCGAVELGPLPAVPGGTLVGAAFPGLAWRVVRPEAGAGLCPP